LTTAAEKQIDPDVVVQTFYQETKKPKTCFYPSFTLPVFRPLTPFLIYTQGHLELWKHVFGFFVS
jgi:hypothetical protein